MPNIKSISILQQADQLDKISQSKAPLFVTKNGKAYLVVMSPAFYKETAKELEHYKQAYEKEREIRELSMKVERSRQNIAAGECYSKEELDKMMDKFLS